MNLACFLGSFGICCWLRTDKTGLEVRLVVDIPEKVHLRGWEGRAGRRRKKTGFFFLVQCRFPLRLCCFRIAHALLGMVVSTDSRLISSEGARAKKMQSDQLKNFQVLPGTSALFANVHLSFNPFLAGPPWRLHHIPNDRFPPCHVRPLGLRVHVRKRCRSRGGAKPVQGLLGHAHEQPRRQRIRIRAQEQGKS